MFTEDNAFKFSSVATNTDLSTYHMPGIVYLGCIENDKREKGILAALRKKAHKRKNKR